MRVSWWRWQPKFIGKELRNRYPDFTDPAAWRKGSSAGREARCQGPKCDARYITSDRWHYYCSPKCLSNAGNYFKLHGELAKPPIMEKDLLSYVRPQHAWKAEAARLREEAEEWKQARIREAGQNGR